MKRAQSYRSASAKGCRGRLGLGIVLCAVALGLGGAAGLHAQGFGDEMSTGLRRMVGELAPPWSSRGWINSEPLDVSQLRGQVILLRFLDDSPTGAASLNDLYRRYREQGLRVVGLYAPQPMPEETDLEHVRRLATALGFEFPVGLDSRWETTNRYWMDQANVEMAVVTFLIDRNGVVRYVQPNGQYEKNSRNRAWRKEFEKLEKQIESLLKEPAKAPGPPEG
ncbi:MAG: redoxin domain-containing protein [Acidobacteria bacterium]|nr:redoxin domain-containing protein [Acidobacteriota bacterium]